MSLQACLAPQDSAVSALASSGALLSACLAGAQSSCQSLSLTACPQELDEYRQLPDDLVGSSKRWMEWMALERPEDEPLPGMLTPALQAAAAKLR